MKIYVNEEEFNYFDNVKRILGDQICSCN